MVILDVVLMAVVGVAIVSLLSWSICTQYRDAECEHLRIRRRVPVKPKVGNLRRFSHGACRPSKPATR